MTQKIPLILIGGGGHCISCIDVIEATDKYQITGILDPNKTPGETILNYKVLGGDEKIPELAKTSCEFLITIGQIKNVIPRIETFKMIQKHQGQFATVISPLAHVSPWAKIKQGTIVMHGAIVNANASVGENCIINTKSLIEHDAVVGNHCHISTSAVLNGGVQVGDETFIGSGTITREYLQIPAKSIIRAGSTLMKL